VAWGGDRKTGRERKTQRGKVKDTSWEGEDDQRGEVVGWEDSVNGLLESKSSLSDAVVAREEREKEREEEEEDEALDMQQSKAARSFPS